MLPTICVLLAGMIQLPAPVALQAPPLAFARQQLSAEYFAEGCAVADIDGDGQVDVVCGPWWYAGPGFTVRHSIYPAVPFAVTTYADNFLTFPEDIDNDGFVDCVIVGPPGGLASWCRNPSATGGAWQHHLALVGAGGESPALADVDLDGRADLLCAVGGALGFAVSSATNPSAPWTFRPISGPIGWPVFGHGLGFDDLNQDGRADLITPIGWFEQPMALSGDPPWTLHQAALGGPPGGAQMPAIDVDGDGDADVVAARDAHGYGLAWFEQVVVAGGLDFVEQPILHAGPAPRGGVQFSQLHALANGDLDGDGLADLVTGKTWLAHNGSDPGALDPPVVVALLLRRIHQQVEFVPVVIDDDSGIGRQLVLADVDADGRLDVITGNKKGCYIHRQQ